MIFLLGIPALISGIGAACASTAATVGTVAATTSAGGILGGLGATAGLGLLAQWPPRRLPAERNVRLAGVASTIFAATTATCSPATASRAAMVP